MHAQINNYAVHIDFYRVWWSPGPPTLVFTVFGGPPTPPWLVPDLPLPSITQALGGKPFDRICCYLQHVWLVRGELIAIYNILMALLVDARLCCYLE